MRGATPLPGWLRSHSRSLAAPLLLLGLYTAASSLYTLRVDTERGERRAEEHTLKQVTLEMTHLQATIEFLLRAGNTVAIREALANLGSNPDLMVGLLMDERQRVLASSRLVLLGRPVAEVWPELARPEHEGPMRLARERMNGVVLVTADRQRVVGYYPVTLAFGSHPRPVGLLFFEHDLQALKAASRHEVEQAVLRFCGLMLLFTGSLALLIHLVLGSRIARMVVTARGVVGGEPAGRGGLGSVSTLDTLGHAFDRMAEEIGRNRQRLEENEESFQRLIERSPDAILIHREGRVIFNNPAAAALLGYAGPQELQGRALAELLPAEEQELLDEGEAARELHWLHRTGRRVLGEVVSFSLAFEGQPATVSIVRDITERRELQEKLRATDRMASLGTLAAGVAHEINNPLSFMLGNLHFLQEELGGLLEQCPQPAQAEEVLGALREAVAGGERVREIVRDLKTFSRGGDGQLGPVDVHAVLDQCASMARSELRHRARLVKEYGELPPVQAEALRLSQVFLNLLINAAQAIPEGKAPQEQEVRLRTWSEGSWVGVEVRDTGTGISPEHLARLFEPFFTTKPVGVGTGLGLSICHGIITSLGGEISVESQPGRGSTFRVRLPVAPACPAPQPSPAKVA